MADEWCGSLVLLYEGLEGAQVWQITFLQCTHARRITHVRKKRDGINRRAKVDWAGRGRGQGARGCLSCLWREWNGVSM